ncbi:MAG: 1-deoxy-D-xylulose-5-phosphate synthase [Planctomycetales bacterium]|nr:1-deoxy-D-xylulose-5-phosphate synthase [Planctomycetales bacterium]
MPDSAGRDILARIESPRDLDGLSLDELNQLAAEMRSAMCELVTQRSAHFASNLGVVELCLALHTTFDFSRDRLIWDTGHQVYPHKLITGRYRDFASIRTKGGLMGYPNPAESPYDLFMTGHAGASVATVLGLKSGDDLQPGQEDRRAVAVIGDGAFPSGIVYEALNNAGGLKKNLIVVLNDNKMSICPRVGGLAEYLDRLRMNRRYVEFKGDVARALDHVPLVGGPLERFLGQVKESLKAGLRGGMLFEGLGARYVGPVDGHNIAQLRKYLELVKDVEGPVLLHVVTEKGHGFQPATDDPVVYHAPAPFDRSLDGVVSFKSKSSRAFTHVASEALEDAMGRDERVTAITAAMCQGNKLEKIRDRFPRRFFDTGICESHAVAFAAGQAKSGLRPVVDIYSTFLQRSYDQVFQEVALQNLPVTFLLDRAGLTGPDGPTHHGAFDVSYQRTFPNMTVVAPGDASDLPLMLDYALQAPGPVSIRYPKAKAFTVSRATAPIETGRSEVLDWGTDVVLLAFGTLLAECVAAAQTLASEGLSVGVVNARFAKPLDTDVIRRALEEAEVVVTVEEAALAGGFGSAVAEYAVDAGLDTRRLVRLGIPDRFIEHGERGELLTELGLDAAGICRAVREASGRLDVVHASDRRVS